MAKRKRVKRMASDVRSDSGYYIPGRVDAGGVDRRNQGPEANRYRSEQKARRRKRLPQYGRITKPNRYT